MSDNPASEPVEARTAQDDLEKIIGDALFEAGFSRPGGYRDLPGDQLVRVLANAVHDWLEES